MRRRTALLLVGVLAFLFHARATKGEFLDYDDARFVVRNDAIDEIGNPARFFFDLDTTASADAPTKDIYRPIRTLSYAVLTELADGKKAAPIHMVAILLHTFTVLLVAVLLMEAGIGVVAASVGALFFGLHPVTVEVTAWICSLGDSWCGFFSVASVLLYARKRWVAAHLALLLALFSKEHAVVLPGIWLAWDLLVRPERWKGNVVRGAAPGLVLCIGFLLFRSSLGAETDQVTEPLGGSVGSAMLTMLAGYGFYWTTILFPFGSTFDVRVPVQEGLSAQVLLGALLLGFTLMGLFFGTRRQRLGLAWFLMGLVPVSNLFVTLKIPTADRFLYIPLMGLALALGDSFERLPATARRVAPAVLLLLGALTVVRIGDWKNDGALVAAGLRASPKSKTFLWAEASQHAEDAVLAIERDDGFAAEEHYAEAVRLYDLLLRNLAADTPIQVWMELGELNLHWGDLMDRRDIRPQALEAYQHSLRAFLMAHELQKRGQGRVLEPEVFRAADQAATLCVRLALPDNPNLEQVVEKGTELLGFLERLTGKPEEVRLAQLLLARAIRFRADETRREESRIWMQRVRDVLEKVEERDGVQLPFLKAQALHYLSVEGNSREGLLRAADLYRKAAAQDRAVRLRAMLYEARAYCTVAKLFGDDGMTAQGLRLLKTIPEAARRDSLRISRYLQTEIESLERTCGQ